MLWQSQSEDGRLEIVNVTDISVAGVAGIRVDFQQKCVQE